jgi:antitoxin (DNA-binding transcriptional repressor) of toxin-antitoxin stability system
VCNSTWRILSEIEAGEPLTLTVDGRPVADLIPHVETSDPWVPATELRRIVNDADADPDLLDDLAELRGDDLGE